MDEFSRTTAIAVVLAAIASTGAQAQMPVRPDAGQILRELERPDPALQAPSRRAPHLSVTPDSPAATPSDDTRIPVKSFKVTGAATFPAAELERLLDPWAGRELTLADLQAAAARITSHYREHGYLVARAYLPAQTIAPNGAIEIAVLEGRIGQVKLKNASRLSDRRARALVSRIKAGDAVHGPALEHSLISLDGTPGISAAHAALQPGASVGLTDLVLALEPGPLASGTIDAGNYGNRYTGAYLLGGTLNLNSPLHLGDQLTVRVQLSDQKLYYERLAYRLPAGGSGAVAGVAWSANRYRLGQDFSVLDANGDARIASIFFSYPFIRSRRFNLNGALAADRKSLQDRIDSIASVTDKKVSLATAGLTGDGQWGDGAYQFSLGYTAGNVDIRSAEARAIDEASARTDGHYDKLTYAASALLQIAGRWSAFASINGQMAGKNLDSSEKFSLGGADGVRAWPQGEAAADAGNLATLELRYVLPEIGRGNMQMSAFIDSGRVRINRDPFTSGENHRRLSGAGLGINWVMPGSVLIKASVAWKIGNVDEASERRARAWLQLVKYF